MSTYAHLQIIQQNGECCRTVEYSLGRCSSPARRSSNGAPAPCSVVCRTQKQLHLSQLPISVPDDTQLCTFPQRHARMSPCPVMRLLPETNVTNTFPSHLAPSSALRPRPHLADFSRRSKCKSMTAGGSISLALYSRHRLADCRCSWRNLGIFKGNVLLG